MKLRKLKEMNEYITEEFRNDGNPAPINEVLFETIGQGRDVDYDKVREGIIELIDPSLSTNQKNRVDPQVGYLLHSELSLTRKEASEGLFWAYLSTQIPEFIQWRWGHTSNRWKDDWKRNAFSWCWWLIELYGDVEPVHPDSHHSRMHLWLLDTPASSPDILREEIIQGLVESPNNTDYSDPVWMKIRAKLATSLPFVFDEESQRDIISQWIDEYREDF